MTYDQRKLGVALVGLGRYSEGQLGPALKETQHCYLAGVVSSSEEKRKRWQAQYDLPGSNLYNYDTFESMAANPAIDIVYVVLPNALHAEYVVRAARTGKHVICEKPMATSVEECQRMIRACQEAGVLLSIGYRLHFDPFNKEMMHLGQDQVFGNVKRIIADDSMTLEKEEWRLDGALAGGGPLMNNGVYCVQAALFVTGELPVAVRAEFSPKTKPDLFRTVEEGIQWEMEFASGKKALCESSYSKDGNLLRVTAERGWFELNPAYEYKGLKGQTSEGPMEFPTIRQQAAQLDDFALCVKRGVTSRVSGEMGMRDVEIMMAIYESARKGGERVTLHLEAYQDLIEL
ncbi:Gfo/Idh/MocA family oxidoreductase [Fulvivirgaceae bacterium PWU5]|uniref:Gfo/Idh/MocA family oxidoreductase n=1 Tax=Dawidia cretensis TaxID=2782350 RepID=A0AAP2DWX5_9BACT|nr:Gfo/Idh/MocA family oxidoreductase [Dawidia cretensis]MBT1707209.1 Gfo/Idh/MocA family oxidoreductase [Dawidia cretensis]